MPFVQYVASLAVLQAVQEQARSRLQERSINMRIKWPNDLYIGGLKVGLSPILPCDSKSAGFACPDRCWPALQHLEGGSNVDATNKHLYFNLTCLFCLCPSCMHFFSGVQSQHPPSP